MQKKLASVLLILIVFILILIGGWYIFFKNGNIKMSTKEGTITQEDMTLSYEYMGQSKWEYNITGELPNPCYTATSGALVAESFPEQVTVTLTISNEQSSDTMCIQVIQELDISGEFSASDKATISFKIDKKEEE